MFHGTAGYPDMTIKMIKEEVSRVADFPPVVLVGVSPVDDHVAGHQGGRVEGHLGWQHLRPTTPRVHHLTPRGVLQLKQEYLVTQLTKLLPLSDKVSHCFY
jgi:hypothetical protein